MTTEGKFGEKPSGPPPDDSGGWMWVAGRWMKIIHDDPEDRTPLEDKTKK